PVLSISQLSEGGVPVKRIQLLDAGDKDLPIVLRGLAESFGLNFQIDANVHGNVQTRLQDVTLEQALDAIVLPQGYSYTIDNGVLRVGVARVQTKIFSLDYVALSRFTSTSTTVQRRIGGGSAGVSSGGVTPGISGGGGGGGSNGVDLISSTSVTNLWDEIKVALVALVFDAAAGRAPGDSSTGSVINGASGNVGVQPGIGGGGGAVAYSRVDADGRRLIINPIAGTVVVTASPAKLAEVATFMNAFEGSVQRQVLIEAKIVEVRLNNDFQFGIDWTRVAQNDKLGLGIQSVTGGGTGTVQFTLGGGGTKINLVLHALQSQGNVSVLSSPRVSAMNNIRATFNVTTDQVFFNVASNQTITQNGIIGTTQQVTPQIISVGIVLDVLPQISADNTITMNIRPHITSILDFATFRLDNGTELKVPNVENRETDTIVRARSGETIVIGGLTQNRIENTQTGVPGLQNIPLVGGLFKGKTSTTSKSELVIFLTPTIVVGQPSVGY
ncbi:MAG: secretin N-terminal domain-containing protein, partial [Gemmatimonadota bacterium]|nr:secretin N-terminal domain-containing protein [Gemmatimonadota bacterium]